MAGCPDADVLAGMLAGTIGAAQRAEIANHAASCETCHALLEGLVQSGGRDPTLPVEDNGQPLDLSRGSHVGRYVIEGKLGAGGMGVVYAASDTELQRRVALKVLRTEQEAVGTAGRERLLREARTLAQLAHPNVVTVFDVGMHRGHRFVAMELVDGGSLTAWLAREPRGTQEIIDRMIEAARGLAAAHAAGFVHRDIKPDNILVGDDARARVTDFGLARVGESRPAITHDGPIDATLTQTGMQVGTPAYMAPEQIVAASAKTDQWSYCATFYEALAGVRPFPAEHREASIESGKLAPPVEGRSVPGWLRPILARGLQRDPAARWPAMDALLHAITRHRYRRRNIAIGTSVVVALAIAVAVVAFARSERMKPRTQFPTYTWVDQRPGCNCPYSACKNGCVSVCNSPRFEFGEKVPGVNTAGNQEALLGTSLDGDTLMYLTGPVCSIDHVMLARRRGTTFVPVDVTSQVATRAAVAEGCCTLAGDGATMIAITASRTGLVQARLDGDRFVFEEQELTGIIPDGATGFTIAFPVLAGDGLTLYYRIDQRSGDVFGPHDGHYYATRPDPKSPFQGPRRLSANTRSFEYVTGVSVDNLSLFMVAGFETNVLKRRTAADSFNDQMPARMPGWRAIPLRDCKRIITTLTPGGCDNEDITYLDAVIE